MIMVETLLPVSSHGFGVLGVCHRLTVSGVWREYVDAKRGSSGEGHHRAMQATSKLYTEWKVERLKLVIGKNVEHWDIVGWKD